MKYGLGERLGERMGDFGFHFFESLHEPVFLVSRSGKPAPSELETYVRSSVADRFQDLGGRFMQIQKFLCLVLLAMTASFAVATPSSNLWAPSTAICQPYAVPHITYDSYFRKGAGLKSGSPNALPTDVGLTVGFLPFETIHGEIGYDMLLPDENPDLVNGKLCTPESALFSGSPAISFGAYAVGFKKNVTDYNIGYLVLQKAVPGIGGSVALGAYHGANKVLFTNSDGKVVQSGLIAAIVSPDVNLGYKGLRKINFLADLQTGKNAFGAWGIGSNVYFTDSVSLLIGPAFLFDRKAQANGSDPLWAVELDIDMALEDL